MEKTIELQENLKDKLNSFYLLFEEINDLHDKRVERKSIIDKELSSIYHRIEGANITHVSQSHNLIKELKDVLNRRREIKLDDALLCSIVKLMKNKMVIAKNNRERIIKKHATIVEEIKVRAK